MAGWAKSEPKPREWICREHDVLWGEIDDDNPGCWVCGAAGEERPTHGMRPGLPEFAGYGLGSDQTVRRP